MISRIKLAPTAPELSQLAYGTWRILDDGATIQQINARLHCCVELGITTIDTAEIYGLYRVEAALGEALRLSPGLRDKLEIVTKAGIYVPTSSNALKVATYDAAGARLQAAVESSLRLLGTDHVELFLVHRPDWLTAIDDTAEGLNALLRNGKARSVGVSNYSASQFEALNSRVSQPLATNQLEFHLLQMTPIADGSLDLCQRLGVAPMAWSPLAGGKLFDPANPASQRLLALAAELGPKYGGATLEQFAYAWILAHPSRPLPVIGTNKINRIEAAAQAASLRLSREDWYAFWTAAQGKGIP